MAIVVPHPARDRSGRGKRLLPLLASAAILMGGTVQPEGASVVHQQAVAVVTQVQTHLGWSDLVPADQLGPIQSAATGLQRYAGRLGSAAQSVAWDDSSGGHLATFDAGLLSSTTSAILADLGQTLGDLGRASLATFHRLTTAQPRDQGS